MRLGFAAMRAGVAPPRLSVLNRYRDQWRFKTLLNRLGITLLLDVGANTGKFAESARLTGFAGRIASFEPNPTDYRELATLASGDSGWTTKCCALGEVDGTVPLNVTGTNSVFSSILAPKDTPPVSEVVSVPVQRLDGLWDEIVRPDDRVFLKTDTQGYDWHVLKGAGDKLANVIGIQIELNVIPLYEGSPHYLQMLAFLESSGFLIAELRPIAWKKGAIVEFDCFAARAPALAPP